MIGSSGKHPLLQCKGLSQKEVHFGRLETEAIAKNLPRIVRMSRRGQI